MHLMDFKISLMGVYETPAKMLLLKKKLENTNAVLLKISIPLKIDEYLPLFSARPL